MWCDTRSGSNKLPALLDVSCLREKNAPFLTNGVKRRENMSNIVTERVRGKKQVKATLETQQAEPEVVFNEIKQFMAN